MILCMFSHLYDVNKYLLDSVYSVSSAQMKMEAVGTLNLKIPDVWRYLDMSLKFSDFIQIFGVMVVSTKVIHLWYNINMDYDII